MPLSALVIRTLRLIYGNEEMSNNRTLHGYGVADGVPWRWQFVVAVRLASSSRTS